MADIFLSYAREDRATAGDLARAFEGFGFSVWWDRQIPHGKNYRQVIQTELAAAKCVLVLWSLNSVDSEFVHDEAGLARKFDKLIPARIRPESDPALGFGQTQTADLTDWRPGGSSDEMELLRHAIESFTVVRSPTTRPQRPITPLPRSMAPEVPILVIPPEARAHNPFAALELRPKTQAVASPPAATLQPKPSFDFDKWFNDNRTAIYGLCVFAFSFLMWWLRQ